MRRIPIAARRGRGRRYAGSRPAAATTTTRAAAARPRPAPTSTRRARASSNIVDLGGLHRPVLRQGRSSSRPAARSTPCYAGTLGRDVHQVPLRRRRPVRPGLVLRRRVAAGDQVRARSRRSTRRSSTNFKNLAPQLQSPSFNTEDDKHYGLSFMWGANVLIYNTDKSSRPRRRRGPRSTTRRTRARSRSRTTRSRSPTRRCSSSAQQNPYAIVQETLDKVKGKLQAAAPAGPQVLGAGDRLRGPVQVR